jgi:phosphoenolpyruvate---glycerone phosphotransferase subunit DhaL
MSTNDPIAKDLIETIANIVIAHADELTELDRAIGDADHGVNLTRGFRAVLGRMDIIGAMPLGKALGEVGNTLIRFVGGASGPLFGKLFVTVGKYVDEAGVINQDTLIHAGEDAIRVLMALGRSDVRQKTMLDVLVPVLDELRSVHGADLLSQIRRRADIAARATVPMVARKGRAAFLGERSVGHMDPGARSCELILSAVCRHLESRPDVII